LKKRLISDKMLFNIIGYSIITIIAIVCILPFIIVISGSITSETYIINHGYSFVPKEISFYAYKLILKSPESILNAYGVTILVTVIGTSVGLFLCSMAAYALQRKDFEWRNAFSYFIYFTTLFSGGLVPWYILMIRIGMKNNILGLIIPHLFGVFYILIIRNFMRGIPEAITESAKIDGANDFAIFIKLIIPLSKAALATIGLFMALSMWNEWYNAMLFISKQKLYPLQYYLYNMLNSAEAIRSLTSQIGNVSDTVLPSESTKLAMTVIATGPIILLYPFVQRYFVKGITIGSVKG